MLQNYVLDLLREIGMTGCKLVDTSMVPNKKGGGADEEVVVE